MTNVQDIDPANPPAPGTSITIPVAQSASRSSLFPDSAVVAASKDSIEIVLLRQEYVVLRQRADVLTADEGGFEVRVAGAEGQVQMYDIGHVRMTVPASIDLALAILKNSIDATAVDKSELIGRIKATVGE